MRLAFALLGRVGVTSTTSDAFVTHGSRNWAVRLTLQSRRGSKPARWRVGLRTATFVKKDCGNPGSKLRIELIDRTSGVPNTIETSCARRWATDTALMTPGHVYTLTFTVIAAPGHATKANVDDVAVS